MQQSFEPVAKVIALRQQVGDKWSGFCMIVNRLIQRQCERNRHPAVLKPGIQVLKLEVTIGFLR